MPRGPLLPLDLLLLDREAEVPLHRQLYQSLRAHVLDGRLAPMAKLPATRALADELGVSRNTVIAAYDALIAEGYLQSVRGSGTRVAPLPQPAARKRTADRAARLPALSARGTRMTTQPVEANATGTIGFHPGRPELATFPFATWTKLVAAQLRDGGEGTWGYQMVGGHPRLRAAIAEYLAVSRGVKCTPEQVIVVTGAQAALDLMARVFMDPGDTFLVEDPGYLGAVNACLNAGGRAEPLPVGEDGWHLRAASRRARLIFVTPSCQWPLGLVMPLETRLELLELAESQDAWIVEDDYDSEYRFRGHPVPAMQGLDEAGRVIYLGTMSKTMFPSLRVAYLVVPAKLVAGLVTALASTGQYPPLFLQMALAEFISRGYFAAHLRRMRRLYARRQQDFVTLCQARLGRWLTVEPGDAGMQVIGRFVRPMDDGAVWKAAIARGVDFTRLSTQYRHAPPEHGLLLGYAGLTHERAKSGVERLRAALEEVEAAGG